MKKYTYLSEIPGEFNHAANKARLDVDRILENRCGKPFKRLVFIEFKNIFQKIAYFFNINNWNDIIGLKIYEGRNIIIQYPAYYNFVLKNSVYSLMDHNDCVLLIHDLNSLRNYGKSLIDEEIKIFNKCKAIIVHNDFMRCKLIELGCKVPMIDLKLFDYLLSILPENSYVLNNKIIFAGNLGKSEFLKNKDLSNLNIQFNLYGPNFDNEVIAHNNVEYKGSYKPDEIPYKLEGSFGLIWDGNSIDTCSGDFGDYMKFNNPHKLSLYIAAGLPVIVWKQAAVAKFVEDNNIGFTINSLREVADRIEGLTNDDYRSYLVNIKKLQEKVCNGYFTNKALDEAEKNLDEV